MQNRTISRRKFVQRTAVGACIAPTIVSSVALGNDESKSANDRINVGIIGLGSRGFNLLDEFLGQPDTQIVAVCDVHDRHYRDRPWGTGTMYGRLPALDRIRKYNEKSKRRHDSHDVLVTNDFRELTRNESIDAIVVATPDHWHAYCTLDALRHGKDVYCEKPITHLFHEGQLVYQEVARQKAVFQTGSQQRSNHIFARAVNTVRNGHLGKISHIEVGLPAGYDKPQHSVVAKSTPAGLDYERWTGPAPLLPYMPARHHRWWRGHSAYGGGVLMDWIGHHNDIAHWSLDLDTSGPITVEAIDWQFPGTKIYDTPQHYKIRSTYENDITITISSRFGIGTKWVGENGWIIAKRSGMLSSEDVWRRGDFDPGEQSVQRSPGHVRNFLDCIKSRATCIAPAEAAHRSITPGHLGYISNQLNKPLRWDSKNEKIIGDVDANELLQKMSHREPWQLPTI